jgi:hypothetical protein
MTRTIRITLTDEEWTEVAAQATRERRTINQQAAYMIHLQIPTMRARRTEDRSNPDTDPLLDLPRKEEEK